jgi:hypothetical protein
MSFWALVAVVLLYNLSARILGVWLTIPWANSLALLVVFVPFAWFCLRKAPPATLTAAISLCLLATAGVFFTSELPGLPLPKKKTNQYRC